MQPATMSLAKLARKVCNACVQITSVCSMLINSLNLQCIDPACELLHQASSQLFLSCRGQVLEHGLQLTASLWHCRRLAEHGQPQPQARWQQRLRKHSCSNGASLPCCVTLARAAVHCSAEGAVLYSLNTGDFFDPTDLEEAVTPEAARQALSQHQYVKALLLTLRLKDTDMLRHMMLSVPDQEVRPSSLLPLPALSLSAAGLKEDKTVRCCLPGGLRRCCDPSVSCADPAGGARSVAVSHAASRVHAQLAASTVHASRQCAAEWR